MKIVTSHPKKAVLFIINSAVIMCFQKEFNNIEYDRECIKKGIWKF